jgi:hypothetical protein
MKSEKRCNSAVGIVVWSKLIWVRSEAVCFRWSTPSLPTGTVSNQPVTVVCPYTRDTRCTPCDVAWCACVERFFSARCWKVPGQLSMLSSIETDCLVVAWTLGCGPHGVVSTYPYIEELINAGGINFWAASSGSERSWYWSLNTGHREGNLTQVTPDALQPRCPTWLWCGLMVYHNISLGLGYCIRPVFYYGRLAVRSGVECLRTLGVKNSSICAEICCWTRINLLCTLYFGLVVYWRNRIRFYCKLISIRVGIRMWRQTPLR